jgi:hypothetical protein
MNLDSRLRRPRGIGGGNDGDGLLPVASQDLTQAGQTMRARMLDEAIAWNLKGLGYVG